VSFLHLIRCGVSAGAEPQMPIRLPILIVSPPPTARIGRLRRAGSCQIDARGTQTKITSTSWTRWEASVATLEAPPPEVGGTRRPPVE
jgi:hypothetical protein